jgi:hypothetical protein
MLEIVLSSLPRQQCPSYLRMTYATSLLTLPRRHVSLVGPYFAQTSSPRENVEHGHSPRHAGTMTTAPKIGSVLPPVPLFPLQANNDPFTEPVHAAFRGWRQASSDVSMQDFSESSTRTNSTYIFPFCLPLYPRFSEHSISICSSSS